MANLIKIKRTNVASRTPTAAQLDYGELAINYADGKLFYKNASDVIQSLGAQGATGVQGATGPIGATGVQGVTGATGPNPLLVYESVSLFPATGSVGFIYLASNTNRTYTWLSSNYVEIGGAGAGTQQVYEYADETAFPATGQSATLYVALASNRLYRWMDNFYVEIGGNS